MNHALMHLEEHYRWLEDARAAVVADPSTAGSLPKARSMLEEIDHSAADVRAAIRLIRRDMRRQATELIVEGAA